MNETDARSVMCLTLPPLLCVESQVLHISGYVLIMVSVRIAAKAIGGGTMVV